MKIRHIPVLALTTCLTLPAAAYATTWQKAESAHFVLYSSESPEATRSYIRKLEAFDSVADAIIAPLGDSEVPSNSKTTVFMLESLAQFHDVDPAAPGGDSGGDVAMRNRVECVDDGPEFFATPMTHGMGSNDTDTLPLLFISYAGRKMDNHFSYDVPGWVGAGLPYYLGVTDFEKDKAYVGLSYYNVSDLKPGDKPAIPYAQVLAGTYHGTNYDAWRFEAWLLTGHMLSSPELRQQFADYLDRVKAGEDATAAFTAVTGKTPADLDADYTTEMHGKGPVLAIIAPLAGDSDITLAPVLSDVVPLPVTYAALRACPPADSGHSLLDRGRRLLKTHPDDDLVRMIAARAEIAFGDPMAAIQPLQAILAKDAGNTEAQQLLGRAWLAEGQRGPADQRDASYAKARNELGKAYNLDPSLPTTLYHFARAHANLPDYPDDQTMDAIALAQDYTHNYYTLYQTELFVRRGRYDDAMTTIKPWLDNSTGRHHDLLQAIADAITAHKSGDEVAALIQTYQSVPETW